MGRILRTTVIATLFLYTAAAVSACGKDNRNDIDTRPDISIPKPEGTTLQPGNNLYGTITDQNGQGIRGIPVSDGFSIVLTDKNGVYQMKSDKRSTMVYYSLPAEYEIATDEQNHLPAFYAYIDNNGGTDKRDFKLKKRAVVPDAFAFGAVGDIHIMDAKSADTFKSEAVSGMREYLDRNFRGLPVFAISLGDIINNCKDDYWGKAKDALGSARLSDGSYLPFYTIIGNHDHNGRLGNLALQGTQDFDLLTTGDYTRAFGPTCYSFNMGKFHFIMLDNYIGMNPPSSTGTALCGGGESGLSEDVYNWMVKDLELVENKTVKTVVLCQHCQMRGFTSSPHYKDILDQLSKFYDAHIFSGHAHICESYKYTATRTVSGDPIRERIHGVPMGNFWKSDYTPDGSPASFYVYKAQGNRLVSWEFQGYRNEGEQMRLYDSTAEYDKSTDWSRQYRWDTNTQWKSGNYLLAHIFHGDEDWDVQFICDGKSTKMTFANARTYDYCVNCYLANTVKLSQTYKYYWDRSENFWYVKLDKPISSMSGWKVVATARFAGSSETHEYSCDKLSSVLSEPTRP